MPIILDGTTGITTPGITNTGTFVFQGPVQVPAGSAATASITTAAGANTGIFFPSSSSVAITTAGTQRFVVSASGDVGIGTSSPTTKLDISVSSTMGTYGPGTVNLTLRNTNTSETNSGSVQFIGYSGNSTSPYQWALISAEKQTSTGDGNYAGKLHFWTTSGGANGEANSGSYKRLTINGNGNVALQGGTQTASGIGITFPGTQSASSDANCLDDYEEGTWTPSFRVNGSTAGVTYSNGPYGFYTKVGNMVTIWGGFRLSNNGSSTGDVTIGGIPFNAVDVTSYQHPGQGSVIFAFKANSTVWNIVIDTSSMFFRSLESVNADTAATDADFDDDTAILFTMTYKAAT